MAVRIGVGIALLLAGLPVAAQQTWVVALQPGPGVDFTDIPPAVAAAAPGDRIEVHGTSSFWTPTYSSFVVDKPIDVEALDGALVTSIRVENLPAGATARVAGFRCHPVPTFADPDDCLLVRDCAGTVVLCDLDVRNRTGDPFDGFVLRNSRSVVIQGVVSLGRYGGTMSGGCALAVEVSDCSIAGSVLTGGYGGTSVSNAAGYDGGPGLWIDGGSVVAVDCDVAGGAGGWGWAVSGDGGTAVVFASATASATLLHAALTAGLGVPGQSLDGAAVDGPARVGADCTLVGPLVNGAVTIPPVTLLRGPSDVALGGALDLALTGAAGTLVGLGTDARGALGFVPGFAEPLWLTATWQPLAVLFLGSSPSTLSYVVPSSPALVQQSFWFQSVAFEVGGRATLTPPVLTRVTL